LLNFLLASNEHASAELKKLAAGTLATARLLGQGYEPVDFHDTSDSIDRAAELRCTCITAR
jgi:hypothetical protein